VDRALPRGTQVRVDVELGAQPQHPLLRADVRRVELRIPDRSLEHRRCGTACLERLRRERIAGRTDRRPAERVLLELEVGRELPQYALGNRHDLRANAVAGEADDPGRMVRRAHGNDLGCVTAPSEADETRAAYFARTPLG